MCSTQTSCTEELTDASSLMLPNAQSSHTGSAVVVPTPAVNRPAGHMECAVHVSVAVELTEASDEKVPAEQSAHSGMAVEVPATMV